MKTYSYLIDNGSKDKTAKDTKKCVIKIKRKFKDYKNCLKATQLEKKKTRKNNVNIENLGENHNKFLKNKKLILKTQQIFKSERYNGFTEDININALS